MKKKVGPKHKPQGYGTVKGGRLGEKWGSEGRSTDPKEEGYQRLWGASQKKNRRTNSNNKENDKQPGEKKHQQCAKILTDTNQRQKATGTEGKKKK